MGDIPAIVFLLIGFVMAVLPAVLYRCCISLLGSWCYPRRQQDPIEIQLPTIHVDNKNSVLILIPTHKHKKVTGSVDGEPMCAVCLSEFEDGEELRTLPECMHSFHVPCIDMWLFSHRSCPICRLDATTVASTSVEVRCVVGPQPQQEEEVTIIDSISNWMRHAIVHEDEEVSNKKQSSEACFISLV